jgi:hypothetical protein
MIVARSSKSLLFDAMLYDVLLIASFYAAAIISGAGEVMTVKQWCGAIMVLCGILLWKIS